MDGNKFGILSFAKFFACVKNNRKDGTRKIRYERIGLFELLINSRQSVLRSFLKKSSSDLIKVRDEQLHIDNCVEMINNFINLLIKGRQMPQSYVFYCC